MTFEEAVAGRGALLIGLLLLLLGAAFYLKVAFSENLITPPFRVGLGILAGTLLFGFGAFRSGGRNPLVAEGLAALGAGLLDLSLWSAVSLFSLVGQPLAFVAMIAVTGALAAVAYARRSQRMAVLGLIAGYLTPFLLKANTFDQRVTAAYLLVLGAGMLGLALARNFRWVEVATFLGSLCYAPWFGADGKWTTTDAVIVASAFFLEFGTAIAVAAIRAGKATRSRVVLSALNVAAFVLMLELELDGQHHLLGFYLLGLAALLIGTAAAGRTPLVLRNSFGWLAAAVVALAAPAFFNGLVMVDVWALEAAMLVAIGSRTYSTTLRLAGVAMFVGAAVALIEWIPTELPTQSFANVRFETLAAFALALLFASREARRYALDDTFTPSLIAAGRIAAHTTALLALGLETFDFARLHPTGRHAIDVVQTALSLQWTAAAGLLFGAGIRAKDRLLRWEGLALFAAALVKVFAVDLASVELVYRAGSFVALGLALTAASALYQRFAERQHEVVS